MASPYCRRLLIGALLAVAPACANREFLNGGVLADVQRRDPQFAKLRVYPSVDFVAVYGRSVSDDVSVSGQAGTVDEAFRGERIETPVRRGRPGAIVASEVRDGAPVLWVSFDAACGTADCAFGFVQSDDSRFRLFQVPAFAGYSRATVYRKRVAPRKAMQPTALYSSNSSTSVYFTMRGATLSVALEVKKRRSVRIDTVVAPQEGVAPGQTPDGP